jgi:hypothetical protein
LEGWRAKNTEDPRRGESEERESEFHFGVLLGGMDVLVFDECPGIRRVRPLLLYDP